MDLGHLGNRDGGWRSLRGPKPFPKASRTFPNCGQHQSCSGRGMSPLPHPLLQIQHPPPELPPSPSSSAEASSWFIPRAAFIFLILPSHVHLPGMRNLGNIRVSSSWMPKPQARGRSHASPRDV